MDPYVLDWLNLLLRFVHLITGIAWIGASFYFIWLDNHLQEPPAWKLDKGIKGDLWAIHGGGFYEVAKYKLAPETLPTTLHWFKWEAYSTWISGFLLLSLMYYVGANTYLIDPRVMQLSQPAAIGIGLASIVGGWFVYDLLCGTRLANHGLLLGILLLGLLCGLAYALSQLFSARGAYIHIGAVIGTMMVGNVFRIIIPSQKALVAAVLEGSEPDPTWAGKAKLRSTHNTYATLPVLFIMISSHYPMTYNHEQSWLVLLAIILLSAAARHYFVLRHTGRQQPQWLVGALLGALCLAIWMQPAQPVPDRKVQNAMAQNGAVEDEVVQNEKVQNERVQNERVQNEIVENEVAEAGHSSSPIAEIIIKRCATCHASQPVDDVFTVPPGGVVLDTRDEMERWKWRIYARTVQSKDMPFINKTNMTEAERAAVGQWVKSGESLL